MPTVMCFTTKRIYEPEPGARRHTCSGRISHHRLHLERRRIQSYPENPTKHTRFRAEEAESSVSGVKTHKRTILALMSALKGNGDGKPWSSLGSGAAAWPSWSSCWGHVGRVWTSRKWERAPRGSIPSGTAGGARSSWPSERKAAETPPKLTSQDVFV